MFSGLRIRFTLLYLSITLLLVALVGGVAYFLVERDFNLATDRALDQRMAREFLRLGLAPPSGLLPEHDPLLSETPDTRTINRPPIRFVSSYDAELAALYVLHLDANGALIPSNETANPTLPPDRAAWAAALQNGQDLRTWSSQGATIRLLSYRVTGGGDLTVIQVGRSLGDQQRTLDQLLLGLLALGGAIAVILGLGGWALAGRSIQPALAAWENQQTFVANASHELRTPLTLLRASAEVVRRRIPADDERSQSLMDDILGECDHLSRMIADLLLLSRLDAGVLTLRHETLAVPRLLSDLGREVERLAEKQGVRLLLDLAAVDETLTIWADSERLRQVLLIVLDNALKHTPEGGEVRIATRRDGRQAQITIADTGAGIPPEALGRLFERFYQVDAAHTSREGKRDGSGLGLSIAKALVDAHGGTIAIASELGAGTTVTLTLPSEAS